MFDRSVVASHSETIQVLVLDWQVGKRLGENWEISTNKDLTKMENVAMLPFNNPFTMVHFYCASRCRYRFLHTHLSIESQSSGISQGSGSGIWDQ